MLKIGDTLPELTLDAYHNDEIESINLNETKGEWLVLLFYPADFTFVCPTELEDAAKLYGDFRSEGAEVMSVSTDSAFVHKAWHDQSPAISKIQYPMLADANGKLSRELGTYIEDEGVSTRATFLFSPEGELVSMELHNNDIGRNVSETLRKLRAARYVREADGEVCPANWQPESETLKPGLDLVGKI